MAFKDAEKKRLKVEQIRELDVNDLQRELEQLQEAQFRLKFRAATEDVTDGNELQFRILRRNIARVKTILREKST